MSKELEDFLDLEVVARYGYEVDANTAEELGAFKEDALILEDAIEQD